MLFLPGVVTLLLVVAGGLSASLLLLVVPSGWLPWHLITDQIPRASLTLIASQLPLALPPLQALVARSSLASTIVSLACGGLSYTLAPEGWSSAYGSTVRHLGPAWHVLAAGAGVWLVSRASRRVSRWIGQAETESESADGYKASIVGICAVCFLLAIRWLCMVIWLLPRCPAWLVLVCVLTLSLCAYLTLRSLQLPRGVLSESAIVWAIVAHALWVCAAQQAAPTLSDAPGDAKATPWGSLAWGLDEALPPGMDAASLMGAAWIVASRLDAPLRVMSYRRYDAPAHASSHMLYLFRCAAIVLATWMLLLLLLPAEIPSAGASAPISPSFASTTLTGWPACAASLVRIAVTLACSVVLLHPPEEEAYDEDEEHED